MTTIATATTDRCPWCGSKISHDRFIQIQAAMKSRMEKELEARFARERKAIEAERAKVHALAAQAKKQLEEAEKRRLKDLTETRQALQKERDQALLKKEAEFARERIAMQKRISDMSKRMKSGGEAGEGAEIDLYEELRAMFPDDQIARTKGKVAGDLLIDVRYRGKSCGRILVDARQRGAWQTSFVTKLRQDQTEMTADHAILSTTVFPAGKRELFIDRGVIVVSPARVRVIVEVLRKALIALHFAKSGETERADKMNRLFKFITSPAFKRRLAEAEDLAAEALEIDVEEKRAHDNVWKKRGAVMTRIRRVIRDLDTEVSAIVESKDDTPLNSNVVVPIRPRVH